MTPLSQCRDIKEGIFDKLYTLSGGKRWSSHLTFHREGCGARRHLDLRVVLLGERIIVLHTVYPNKILRFTYASNRKKYEDVHEIKASCETLKPQDSIFG